MRNRITGLAGVLSLTVAMSLGTPSEAARVSLIRDAEIENIIRGYAAPLFDAAGLVGGAVRIHLIQDGALNAFVAGGLRIFVHTGLLLAAESPSQIKGVIAHEIGHIAGGHLAELQDVLQSAKTQAIVAYLLGVAAAAAGSIEGGQALIFGGQGVAQQSVLMYRRNQEQAADQFAVTVLEDTGQSAQGLLEFLTIMGGDDPGSERTLYLRTHPLTRDRMEFVRNQVVAAARPERPPSPQEDEAFRRMKAKLRSFLSPAARTLALYPETNTGIEARYARAIAYYHKRSELPRALTEIDSLLAARPDDPYFHELKGQMLFENGRVVEAIEPYRRAVELLPESSLLHVGLAHALIETGDEAVLGDAAEHLEAALRRDRRLARAWRFLSIAYGRSDKPGQSALASAEYAMLGDRYDEAISFATRAATLLPFGSPGNLRAEDLRSAAQRAKKGNRRLERD
jgi:predicted Zn-dependent protease